MAMTYVVFVDTISAVAGWRVRLGGLLLLERRQVKQWNESEAATAADISAGTVTRIELGQNCQIDKMEAYALALGKPLEDWLREALLMPAESAAAREFREWDGVERRGLQQPSTKQH